MVFVNQGKPTEFALRVVVESEIYGREYFDHCADTPEILETVSRLVKHAADETAQDGIERLVSIAIVPKASYGDECGYGFGIWP